METLFESGSLNCIPNYKGKARQRVFGAEDINLPTDLSIFRLLNHFNEKQLLELNEKLCQQYEEDLVHERSKEKLTKAKEDPNREKLKGFVYGQPWLGPPLQKRAGKFHYDDQDEEKGIKVWQELLTGFKEIERGSKHIVEKLTQKNKPSFLRAGQG